jgi:uncharacterized protein
MTPRTRKPSRHFIVAVLGLAPLACLLAPSLAHAASTVEKLQEFPLDEVQITDEYQTGLFAKEMKYLLDTLDADKLLVGFKAMSSGNNSPSGLYGGWENSLIRGHTMGHWLSAVAHAYGQTKGNDATMNAKIKTKLDHVITMLKTYQRPDGFLFATTDAQFGAPEGKGGDSWVPWYTMHKIMAGLVDVVKYEGNTEALDVASKLGDWISARSSGWDSGTRSKVLGMEYGGMNDALYELYKLTTKENHLAAAHAFDQTDLFTTTAAGNDTLNGKHANTTIPKFIGALNRYRTLGTGEQSYFTAADKFLEIVLKNHTYITGGNSEAEFFHEAGKLDARRTALNNETCNSYNMSKLTEYLFLSTGDIKYADYYERVHINEILASINPDTAMTTYFKAMGTGFFKVFSSETNHFWCCTGTGMENFTRLNDSVYFHDAKDLWLTYYVSSTLSWKDRGLSLTQTTDLPLSDKVNITITAAPTDAVALKFRKPYWTSTCQVGITVNGQAVNAAESGGFYSVSRVWQANDKVELTFPMFVQFSRLQDNQNAVAFTYGPIVLSAGLGTSSMTTQPQGVQVLQATKPSGIQEGFAINSDTTINDWLSNIQKNLVQTPGKLEFNLKNTDADGKLVFIPHFSRYKDRYGIYWKLTGGSGGTATTTVTCPTGTGGTGGSGGSTGTAGATGTGGKGGTTGVTSSGGIVVDGGKTASSGGGAAGAAGNGGKATSGGSTSGGAGVVASSSSSVGGQGGKSSVVASNSVASGSSGNPGGGSAGSNNSGAAGDSGSNAGAGSSGRSSGTAVVQGSSGGCSFAGQTSNGQLTIGLLLGLGLMLARRRSNRRR